MFTTLDKATHFPKLIESSINFSVLTSDFKFLYNAIILAFLYSICSCIFSDIISDF